MKKGWTKLKQIIDRGKQQKIFLSLMDEEGNILSANARMLNELGVKDPRLFRVNFFNIIRSDHLENFKKLIATVAEKGASQSMELYIRNGTYSPMKWEVNLWEKNNHGVKKFLCFGYKLILEKGSEDCTPSVKLNGKLVFEGPDAEIFFQEPSEEPGVANEKTSELFSISLEDTDQLQHIRQLWNTKWNVTTEKGESVLFDKAPFMKALQTGVLQKETLIVHMKNENKRWLAFDSLPVFELNEAKPFSVISNVIDITDKKVGNKDRGELGNVFKIFIDKTPNLAWVINEEENLIFANHSFYQYFGMDSKIAVGKKINELVPASVFNSLYKEHLQVLKTGMPVEKEDKILLADGTRMIFHITIFQIESPTGKKMVGGQAVQLPDTHKIEDQLREANNRLLNFNRAVNDAIWEWDMQAEKIFRNENLLDMIGYPMEETKGLSWWIRRIHPEDRDRVSNKIKKTIDHNEISWEDEYRFKCADGIYKYINDRGFIVYENGLPVKMIGSLQDITAFRNLKDQLLEEKLQRQREISETVIRVQEMERRRIGNELHDNVNQILTTTRLFVDMLHPASEEEKDIKKKSIDYILTAIEEIRKLSRELAVPELKEKSLVESIRKMVDDINISNAVKVKFVHDNESDLLSPGKKVTLFRILQEQMKNILKYSKANEVTVYLDSKSDHAQLIVQDNGIGFDAKHTKTGVGLSSIYDRANFYNGTVNLDTTPGHGCTLTVKLPIL